MDQENTDPGYPKYSGFIWIYSYRMKEKHKPSKVLLKCTDEDTRWMDIKAGASLWQVVDAI